MCPPCPVFIRASSHVRTTSSPGQHQPVRGRVKCYSTEAPDGEHHGLRDVPATFLVQDNLTLKDWSERFDTVIDSGLFHVFGDDDRRRYVEGLATVLKPGGRLFLLCFSDEEPGTQGPRRVSKDELHAAFDQGWVIEYIEPSRYEVRPDLKGIAFSEGGPKAWFVVVQRAR